jgi:hypothetical protein
MSERLELLGPVDDEDVPGMLRGLHASELKASLAMPPSGRSGWARSSVCAANRERRPIFVGRSQGVACDAALRTVRPGPIVLRRHPGTAADLVRRS